MAANWRQRQKQELRQLLYETAVELFEATGYEQTKVEQITKQVGVAKGTFFNHFPTKEHVVAQWYDNLTFKTLTAARERDLASAEEAVCGLLTEMARQAQSCPELLLAKSRYSSHPLLMEAEQTQDDEVDAFVLEQCKAGKATGELAVDLDEAFFVGLLGAVLTGSSRAWVRVQPRFDFPAVVEERLRFLFRAAKPPRS